MRYYIMPIRGHHLQIAAEHPMMAHPEVSLPP